MKKREPDNKAVQRAIQYIIATNDLAKAQQDLTNYKKSAKLFKRKISQANQLRIKLRKGNE